MCLFIGQLCPCLRFYIWEACFQPQIPVPVNLTKHSHKRLRSLKETVSSVRSVWVINRAGLKSHCFHTSWANESGGCFRTPTSGSKHARRELSQNRPRPDVLKSKNPPTHPPLNTNKKNRKSLVSLIASFFSICATKSIPVLAGRFSYPWWGTHSSSPQRQKFPNTDLARACLVAQRLLRFALLQLSD